MTSNEQTRGDDRLELVRELGRVRERGIMRVESPNTELRQWELPALRKLTARFDTSNRSFPNKLLDLIRRAVEEIPEGLAKSAALHLYGLDSDPTFPRPTQWRTEARKMFPELGADEWRKGMELEILGLIASNVAAMSNPVGFSQVLPTSPDYLTRSGTTLRLADSAPPVEDPYGRDRPVFIQYLNPEILACYGYAALDGQMPIPVEEAFHATRLAVLATDSHLVMPASYLFEVPGLPAFIERLRDLVALGQVNYCSAVKDLDVYKDRKTFEYRADLSNPYIAKAAPSIVADLAWSPRQSVSTAQDITSRWKAGFNNGGELYGVLLNMAPRWNSARRELEEELANIPERLDGQAFVSRFVSRAIPVPLAPNELLFISLFLSKVYLESYLADLGAMILHDLRIGELSCGLSSPDSAMRDRVVSARSLDLGLRWLGLYSYVHRTASWVDLVELRSAPEFGTIAVATQGARRVEQLRRAIARARRYLPQDKTVDTLDDAKSLVEVVAAQML